MSTQQVASWCSSMRYAGIVHDVVHSSQSCQDPCDLSLGPIGRKNTVCLSWILTSMYWSQSWWLNVWRLNVDVMEYSTLNYIVLQWRINKIASCMSLLSSEKKNYSWNISAILISPFCSSSSCCQACFPSIVWPTKSLSKLTQNMLFYSPEMEPLHSLLIVLADEEDGITFFETSYAERVTLWFNVNPIPCVHRNDARWFINKFTSLWFCFFLWSACTILPIQLYRLFFRLIFRNFCVVPLRDPSQNYLIHEKF